MLNTALLLSVSMIVGQAESVSPLPEDVAAYLQYVVGTWEVAGTAGETSVAGTYSVRWAPGKHCVLLRYTPAPDQPEEVAGQMSGVLGYDAASKRTIEKNFWTNGSHYTICYDVADPVAAKGVIKGELVGVEDGKEFKCDVEVERKGRREFVYKSQSSDGVPIEVIFQKVQRPKGKKSEPKEE
jgi:hypothetical protein